MNNFRHIIAQRHTISQAEALQRMIHASSIGANTIANITQDATELVRQIRDQKNIGLMESFLGEYGLSTQEGVALMCLAEAFLRIPDAPTIDELIHDKIVPGAWGQHLSQSHSSLVNASSWGLLLTGKILDQSDADNIASILRKLIKRLGEPVIRTAIARMMRELGNQFVLGQTIESAIKRASKNEKDGYTYSYDMLGEAAVTQKDADRYFNAYIHAIETLGRQTKHEDARFNPGISIKLSALHPRYETRQSQRVMAELVPRVVDLVQHAKKANIGVNIDAEEAARLEISLDIIEVLLQHDLLDDWNGFGVVIQAYSKRAFYVIDWLYGAVTQHQRNIMVRLVKGAYWDTEMKHAQTEGHEDFSLFTQKAATDISYICCAKKLLGMRDHIYPQFATHNAHTAAAILELCDDRDTFEFQRLHGMGEALHAQLLHQYETRCRIYAPVGAHKDLLAYLVRRLLENGANSSFVSQIADATVPVEQIAADPFAQLDALKNDPLPKNLCHPSNLFAPDRANSKGWDIDDPRQLHEISQGVEPHLGKLWDVSGLGGTIQQVHSPADNSKVGSVTFAHKNDVQAAFDTIKPWQNTDRPGILRKAADLYEQHAMQFFALLMREAGKNLPDCVAELREAVDFLRYYAVEAEKNAREPAGIFTCISPWNFPLAIFTGQIAAALSVGNGVLAKPAETTSIIADFAVKLLHQAGVPEHSLVLLPGAGPEIGAMLTSNPKVNGVCFTGSTQTAHNINRLMAEHLSPHAALIAETGGLNAMIVDSSALAEQAIRDILDSAFQSSGQRCSALRIVYLQSDIASEFKHMLFGAMDELKLGMPWAFDTDIGPVIDETAKAKIDAYIAHARDENRLLKQVETPKNGLFVGPAAISVSGIQDMGEEIFGPVLHIAEYDAAQLDDILDTINAKGYGLTFGLHSRIDGRVQKIVRKIKVGNIYINRNQIGAIVGSQPFGGEGLSGTGPKAGGPHYVKRFTRAQTIDAPSITGSNIMAHDVNEAFQNMSEIAAEPIDTIKLHGPTGESNQLSTFAKNRVLCLGPTLSQAQEQAQRAQQLGCKSLIICPGAAQGLNGAIAAEQLTYIQDLSAVIYWSKDAHAFRKALSKRNGPIVPLIGVADLEHWLINERHICVDTTAAGGNATLMST